METARSKLVSTICDPLYHADKTQLKAVYFALDAVIEYIAENPTLTNDQILSVLRNITSNIILINSLRLDDEDMQ